MITVSVGDISTSTSIDGKILTTKRSYVTHPMKRYLVEMILTAARILL